MFAGVYARLCPRIRYYLGKGQEVLLNFFYFRITATVEIIYSVISFFSLDNFFLTLPSTNDKHEKERKNNYLLSFSLFFYGTKTILLELAKQTPKKMFSLHNNGLR